MYAPDINGDAPELRSKLGITRRDRLRGTMQVMFQGC